MDHLWIMTYSDYIGGNSQKSSKSPKKSSRNPQKSSQAWSRKYPYDASSGGRDGRGLSPIWLRLEHNCIDWRVIDHRLHRADLTWCTAELGALG